MTNPRNIAEFKKDLEEILNRNNMENASNTPDWILAKYLYNCLQSFEVATQEREQWYGIRQSSSEAAVMLGPNCPAHRDTPMEIIATTNQWKYYCYFCDRRYNDKLEPKPVENASEDFFR